MNEKLNLRKYYPFSWTGKWTAFPSFSGVTQVLDKEVLRKQYPILLLSAPHSLRVKRSEFEAHHSPPSIAWAKIARCCAPNGNILVCLVCSWRDRPSEGQGLLIYEVSRSNTTHRVLWMSDQPVAQTCTWQHTTLTTDGHPCSRWDSNPQSPQASGRRPTP